MQHTPIWRNDEATRRDGMHPLESEPVVQALDEPILAQGVRKERLVQSLPDGFQREGG